jgi:phospholipid transport system substrate-binding protein
MKRILLAAALSCLAWGSSLAADSAVSAPITALNAALISAMQSGKSTPFIQRYTTLAPVVQRAFDLPEVLQASIGPRWSQLPPKQQADLTTVFKQFTIASYVANFNSFDGEKFTVAPDTRAVGAEQVVSTQIVPKSGDSNKLDYVMRQNASGWHAIDVLLDGTISRAAVQRSDFRSLLTGNDAQPLIDSLKKKVAGLSGGVQLP